jgi:hypothetical protein
MEHLWRNIMKTRTILSVSSVLIFGLAIAAFSQPLFAQTNVTPSGIFQLNVAKSKFPGAALKSQTAYFDGQKTVVVGIDAQGNGRAIAFEVIEDAKPHPVTGFPQYDSSAYTRVDAHTVNFTRFKDGKVVQTGNSVISSDGKTWTATSQMPRTDSKRFRFMINSRLFAVSPFDGRTTAAATRRPRFGSRITRPARSSRIRSRGETITGENGQSRARVIL